MERTFSKITNFFPQSKEDEDRKEEESSNMAIEIPERETSQAMIEIKDEEPLQGMSQNNIETFSSVQDEILSSLIDPGLWPETLSSFQIKILIDKGPSNYQNGTGIIYPRNEKGRKFSSVFFLLGFYLTEKK